MSITDIVQLYKIVYLFVGKVLESNSSTLPVNMLTFNPFPLPNPLSARLQTLTPRSHLSPPRASSIPSLRSYSSVRNCHRPLLTYHWCCSSHFQKCHSLPHFISKIPEKAVVFQLHAYLTHNPPIMPPFNTMSHPICLNSDSDSAPLVSPTSQATHLTTIAPVTSGVPLGSVLGRCSSVTTSSILPANQIQHLLPHLPQLTAFPFWSTISPLFSGQAWVSSLTLC